jgi:hypothetical protein
MTVDVTWVGWLKPRTPVRWAKFPELSARVTDPVANRTSGYVVVWAELVLHFLWIR